METVIGLAMFGLIASAVAAFASATASAWKQGRDSTHTSLAPTRVSVAANELLRSVCAPVWMQSDPEAWPAMLVWAGDTLSEPDGLMQVGELMLIEHDPDQRVVWVHRVIPWADMTQTQRDVALVSDWTGVDWATFAQSFKSLAIVAEPHRLGGLTRRRDGGGGVISARFGAVQPDGGRPTILLDLVIAEGESRRRLLSSVTLRTHKSVVDLLSQTADEVTR
jgi:hypothetical protein